eukprot:10269356-Alexandrium_andersonii.AAC.1
MRATDLRAHRRCEWGLARGGGAEQPREDTMCTTICDTPIRNPAIPIRLTILSGGTGGPSAEGTQQCQQ